MAKYYNNKIKSGRVAGSVFAVRYGEVIERAYNPIVANPSTEAQVETRAKLKLMSQLSAVLGDVIAIPRQGAVSSRNRFTSKNFGLATYADSQADITVTNIQLTDSAVGIVPVSAVRASGASTIACSMPGLGDSVDRVVYVAMVKQSDGRLRVAATGVATAKGDGSWPLALDVIVGSPAVVLAYGVRDNTEAARVVFGNLTALSAETVAKILVTRVLTNADVTVTETVGANAAQ